MRAAGDRIWPALAGLALSFCALFFGSGLSDAPLVWIGGLALVAAALWLAWAPPQGAAALLYVGCLAGLALWCGLSVLWSASPDASWVFTNRTLAYAGFAALGVLAAPRLDRAAAAATALAAAVAGWALLAKCVPALYSDYGRVARLRAPLDDWNMLALVCAAGVVLALWLGSGGGKELAVRSRVAGTVLLYLFVVALLLTYSRFGVVLACLAAAAWILQEDGRADSLVAIVVAAVLGGGVFAVAFALKGITSDGQPHATRVHDGWIFLLVLLGGGALVALVARFRVPPRHHRAIERAAAVAALLVVAAVVVVSVLKANTVWREFTNPAGSQISNQTTRLTQLGGAGNRWTWWTEAWRGFTGHPLGGTGAGTFRFTDLRYRTSTDITALEPHNVPLQFLSETGIVGFLLLLGAVGAVLLRARGVLGIVFAVFALHSVVNYDWSFAAVCAPFLFLGGVVVAQPREQPVALRRPLLAAAATLFALGCVYSLAAPWLAQRAEASLHFSRAHSYDPLNVSIITDQAALAPTPRAAERYYREAISLEPTNAELWYGLATFYAQNKAWVPAYRALGKAYAYDPYGKAGQCGVADTIRRKVGVRTTCRGAGSPSTP